MKVKVENRSRRRPTAAKNQNLIGNCK